MSERANFRGSRGGARGSGAGDHRGGGRGGREGGGGGGAGRPAGASGGHAAEKPKKENILDLNKYMDKEITVKFNGGREGNSCSLVSSFSPSPPKHIIFPSIP